MSRYRLVGHALVTLFFLGAVLWNYPFLRLFGHGQLIGGIPVLYAYLFGTWLALIGLMAYVVERK